MINPEEMDELVGRVAGDRDRAAFVRLFDHFAPRLNSYLQRLGADSGTAEEIAQDVMSVLWHKASLFDPAKSALGTWLYRIARNRRIDILRSDKSAALTPDEPMLHPTGPPSPMDDLDRRRLDAKVREALALLPEDQADLVRRAFYQGLSHSEIAEETGLPLGTVKSRIRLAFSRLRRTLEAAGLVDDRG